MGILEIVERPLHGGLPGIVRASGCHVEGGPRGLVRVCVEWLTLSQWVPLVRQRRGNAYWQVKFTGDSQTAEAMIASLAP